MLDFSDVSLRRGTRLLISGASFALYRGEKAGITGANGSGKSSLLALVRGELELETGTFERPPRLTLAHVAQEWVASDRAAIEIVLDGDAELRSIERAIAHAESGIAPAGNGVADGARRVRITGVPDGHGLAELHARYAAAGGYEARSRAARLMSGLGFSTSDETRPANEFSGGWRVRLNLAQALMCRSDLLLLDEPTNHLDLDAILYLEGWLESYAGTLLLVTHDREFLDHVVNRVVHLEHGGARAYRGNYSAFEEQRAAELAEQSALRARQQREIAHMRSFVDRFRAQASKARQAQSRLKALARLQRIAPAHVDSQPELALAAPEKLPRPLLRLEDQSAGYAEQEVLRNVTLTLEPGDRIGLLGRNGAGKSTCMRLLAGELPAACGKRSAARDLAIGYFAQHQIEQLDPRESALRALQRTGAERAARSSEQALREYLAGFGFRGERVFEPVAPFSGGEKARLALALVAYQRPNLLLLDEPTNHLDLEMRQALVIALQDYPGAVVLVSHDRHLLRTVVDRLYVVHGGEVAPFDGDLDEYAGWLAEAGRASSSTEGGVPALRVPAAGFPARETDTTESVETRRLRRRREAERRNRLSPLRAAAAEAEKALERLQREQAQIEAALADPGIYTDVEKPRLRELLERQVRLTGQSRALETAWLEHSERLDAEVKRLAEGPEAG